MPDAQPLGAQPQQPRFLGCWRWVKRGCLAYVSLIICAIPAVLVGQYFGYLGPRIGWDSTAATHRTWLRTCKSNLRQLDTALHAYASQHQNHYPANLQDLVRARLLSAIPTCPSHSGPSYTNYATDAHRIAYSLACVGDRHNYHFHWRWEDSSVNIPCITSEDGLIDQPAH